MPSDTPYNGEPQRLVVLVGLPGSGKSTWARQHGSAAISSDEVRWLLADDSAIQTIHGSVFATVRYLVRRRIELGRPVTYIDATNLTRKERRPYIKLGQLYGCRVEAVFFDVPLDVCKSRNGARNRIVPDEAIEGMVAKLQLPALDEGFDRVTRLAPEPPSSSTEQQRADDDRTH